MVDKIRKKIKVYGIVQGVGFRPFIFRLANKLNLTGFVKNLSDCVYIEVQGKREKIENFLKELKNNPPPISEISNIKVKNISVIDETEFKILPSSKNTKISVHISPDIAICEDCVNELFNPSDRRYYFPFINCTNCGPRLTIIKDIPYDRVNTSMSKFKMCDKCKKEYENPYNRRFHAEPIACHECGPEILLVTGDSWLVVSNKRNERYVKKIIDEVVKLLKKGKIIAIKGIGGFHLTCDATNYRAVEKLRNRKFRDEKPFALMVKDFSYIEEIAYLNNYEKKILKSPEAPILLLKKRKNSIIAKNVAPELNYYGIMLPYTPLHYLILDKIPYLIMTSANISDEPICIDNNEAKERLKDIADCFLLHNRDILVRCDDSVCACFNNERVIFRRSRGFSPKPIILNKKYDKVLSLGAHMKNTICILKDNYAFLSPHIGDLDTKLSRDFFIENINLMKRITDCNPEIVAVDLHPDYFSTQFAQMYFKEKKIIKIQHHHAHIVSCMAENNLDEQVIGVALDGTGYGIDGTIWGGEIFLCDCINFKRVFHIKNYNISGGERAIKEIFRIAFSFIFEIFKDKSFDIIEKLKFDISNIEIYKKMHENKINSFTTSSAGRMFDAVSAILGIKRKVSFDSQGAILLEAVSEKAKNFKIYPFEIEDNCINLFPTVEAIVEDKIRKVSNDFIGKSFHITFVKAFIEAIKKVKKEYGIKKVVLSGGCFQNKIIFTLFKEMLEDQNFEVYSHSKVPPNDGGISLGQAVIVGEIQNSGEWLVNSD